MAESQEPNRDHVGRAGVLLASGTIVSRILGFVGAILLARTLGTVGSGADAFALANQLPNNIYALVAGGILTAISFRTSSKQAPTTTVVRGMSTKS